MTSEADKGKTQQKIKASKRATTHYFNKEGYKNTKMMLECGRRFVIVFIFCLVVIAFNVSATKPTFRSDNALLGQQAQAEFHRLRNYKTRSKKGYGVKTQAMFEKAEMASESSAAREMVEEAMGSDAVETLNKALEDRSNNNKVLPTERMLVHSGEVSLTTPPKQGDAVAIQIEDIITSKGGYLENKSSRHGSLSLTVRIPSTEFHDFLSKLNNSDELFKGCTVTDLSIRSKDVTDSFVDASSRASTLQASIQSLQVLMTRADSVDEVLKVQKELNRLTQDYESQKARADSLQKQANLSTLNIDIREEYQRENDPEEAEYSWLWDLISNVGTTFLEACRDVLEAFALLVNALVYQSVIVVSIGIPLWLGYLAYRACCRVHLQRAFTNFSTLLSNQ